MRLFFFVAGLFFVSRLTAQVPDRIYAQNIYNIKLYMTGNLLAYPVWPLNSSERMELHFDDIDGEARNYSYTFLLCNANWMPADISQFDYLKGFSQQRITTYRFSSIANTRYVHYQTTLPDRNCMPSRSGNYLLKVFADGDTSKLLFTRRVLVTEDITPVAAQVQQPFNGQYFRTYQKIQFTVNTSKLNLMNAMQQLNVCILQNNRWDNYLHNIRPTFMRPGSLEFNTEQDAIFPAGREWRWLDLRSFRLQSDRVEHADYSNNKTEIYVKADIDRSQQRAVFYRDNNGMYFNDVTESINPFWQADYATVHFSFIPPGNISLTGKEVYLFGELTNYGDEPTAKMKFNEEKSVYETSLFLKQGYYDYCYVTVDQNTDGFKPSFEFTEGNSWDTENNYTILVYYRALGDRADRLIGFAGINSLEGRTGF